MTETQLYPADAEARLGLDRVRQRLHDHVRTPYGRERLDALRPSSDAATVRARLDRAGDMTALVGFDDPVPLREAADVRPVLRRVQPKGALADGDDLWEVRGVLETLRRLHDYLHARRQKAPSLWGVAQRIVVLKALEDRIARTVDDQGRVRDDASAALLQISRQLATRQGQLRETLLAALREAQSHGYATEGQPTMRGGRAVIPVRAEAKRKVQGFVHDVSATGQTVYIEPASVLDLNNEIREIEVERAREIERLLREISGHLRHHRPEIEAGLDALGQLDALVAIARLSVETGALVPEVGEGGALRLVRARHPVLVLHVRDEAARLRTEGDAGAEARAVVPLDLTLADASGPAPPVTTLVITGPNAGGKSVAMKTVGLLSLMAACGLPVPADPGTRIPLPTRLFVDLGDQQSIQDDLSTFTSHLTNIRRMLDEADGRSLCLLDEAGTGTDPAEGGALAESVLRRLTERGALVLATTHHGTLKAFAHTAHGVENGSMEFDRATLAPTYRFRAGVPGSSYAFEIASRVGLPADLLAEARGASGEGKGRLEDLIADFEARTAAAERRQQEAEARLAEAERTKTDYDARLARLRADADERRAQALAQAEAILADANAAVENTVREIREAQADKETTHAAREKLAEAKARVQRRQRTVTNRQRQRAPSSTTPRPTPAVAGPIDIGDQVRVEGTDAVGEVIEIDARDVIVAFGSITSRVKPARLTKVGGARPQRVEIRTPRSDGPGGARAIPAVHVRTRLDLRGQRVEDALSEAQRFVDEAIAAGLHSVEILHGKGTGALRLAIHQDLARRGDVASFAVAPWDQGGDGVTVVSLA